MERSVEIVNVIVHPIVLLSIVDHFNRIAKNSTNKRVVGTLLGEVYDEDDPFSNANLHTRILRHSDANNTDSFFNPNGINTNLMKTGFDEIPEKNSNNESNDETHMRNLDQNRDVEENLRNQKKIFEEMLNFEENSATLLLKEDVSLDDEKSLKSSTNNIKKNTSLLLPCKFRKKRRVYIHITNSFAVPMEEDSNDPSVWFFDTNYAENLFSMFKKVNVREKIVGWYSTGPKIKLADLSIHQIFMQYYHTPVYLIVDMQPKDLSLPIDAYYSVDQPTTEKEFSRTFVHIPSTIGAYEAEEVGIEHLLRELKNSSTSTLATRVGEKLTALKVLILKLNEISEYLKCVINNEIPGNPKTLYNLQNIFNLLKDMEENEIVTAFCIQTNDTLLAIYLGTIIRAVMGLHSLINNKIESKKAYQIR